jgi:hypothetical protein
MSARVFPLPTGGSFDSGFDPSRSPMAAAAPVTASPTQSPLPPPPSAHHIITTTGSKYALQNTSSGGAVSLQPAFVKHAITTVQVNPASGAETPSLVLGENANGPIPPPLAPLIEKGKATFRDGKEGLLYYEGDLVNRMPHGQGVMESEDKSKKYVGHFESGKRSGQGILTWPGYCYNGLWKNGKKEGLGTLQVDGAGGLPTYYTGVWVNGQKQGKFTVANGPKKWDETYQNDQPVNCCTSCTML